MKNKLHKSNTTCHAEQVAERSRSAASHNTSIHVTSSLSRSHKINKLLFLLLFPLWGLGGYAQNYQWQWAVNGGGAFGSGSWDYEVEQIFDLQVGTDNNYYFVAKIKDGNPKLGSQPVTVYGNGGNDIFIFSTTCDGTVRWSQAIGGGGLFDAAYNIALDSNNNVYVGANVDVGSTTYPVHFSSTEVLPGNPNNPNTISDFYKTTFLVKYDSNGQFIWKKALQGDVISSTRDSGLLDIVIDSNDIIHFIAGFKAGTHLDSHVTVNTPVTIYQYYLAKYDTAGNYISSMQLPIPHNTGFVPPSFTFKLDEARNRYYIGGFRSYVNTNENIPLTYAGTAFTHNAYVLAIDATNGSEIWRREMDAVIDDSRIYDLVVDDGDGDIYIGGKLVKKDAAPVKIIDSKNPTVNPYTFTFDIAYGNMPFIAKLNSSGTVQWARTPSGYNSQTAITGQYYGFGLALRNNANEIAFATMGNNTIWDGFSINRAPNNQPDPLLMRFNKNTGAVVGMHDIQGSMGSMHMLTAVAVDNDGNYVVGGAFEGYLFPQHSSIPMLMGNGHYDFFVAKLGASVCGTAVSTKDFNKLNVNVYPNPTNDIVNIETQETLQNYEVYNVLGQQIQKGMFNNNNQINLHGVAAGTYFIKVTTAQGSTATVKVVKK